MRIPLPLERTLYLATIAALAAALYHTQTTRPAKVLRPDGSLWDPATSTLYRSSGGQWKVVAEFAPAFDLEAWSKAADEKEKREATMRMIEEHDARQRLQAAYEMPPPAR